jgi:chromosome segregation ATPase
MRKWKLGLAVLVPALIFACQKTPAEKKQEISNEMAKESVDHAKDTAEIRKDESDPVDRSKELNEEHREHAEEMTDLQKEAFLVDANRELDRLDRNIDSLKDRAGKMSGEAKADLDQQIEVLENKYDAIKDDMDEAKAKTGNELFRMKQNFEASLRDLEQSYNDLAAKAG